MPPKSGVIAINRIDSTVPVSIVRCASPRRIARPAKSAPNPLAISAAAKQHADGRADKSHVLEIDDVDRRLDRSEERRVGKEC